MITIKALLSVIIAVCFITGIACKKNLIGNSPDNSIDVQSVAADKNALAITYAAGDSAESVTRDVILPTQGSRDCYISWVTSNSSRCGANSTHCSKCNN